MSNKANGFAARVSEHHTSNFDVNTAKGTSNAMIDHYVITKIEQGFVKVSEIAKSLRLTKELLSSHLNSKLFEVNGDNIEVRK